MTPFERRIEAIPYGWKGPTVDVLDTVESVLYKLEELKLDPSPELVLGLTALIIDEKNRL